MSRELKLDPMVTLYSPAGIPRTFGDHCCVDGGCSSPLGKRGVNSRGCIDPRVGGPTRKENRSLS